LFPNSFAIPNIFQLDYKDISSFNAGKILSSRLSDVFDRRKMYCIDHQIFVFNGAVCLSGNSIETMKESLQVNTLAPLYLAQSILSMFHCEMNPFDEEIDEKNKKITLLFVSSGDGEKSMINSEIVKKLESIDTFEELNSFILDHLMMLHSEIGGNRGGNIANDKRGSENYIRGSENQFEFAYGDTPHYSLSKCLLNKGIQILHKQINGVSRTRRIRLLSCCPGDFFSPMSSLEEIERMKGTAALNSAATSAAAILDVAMNFDRFAGGKFYRYGQVISW
jgi:hypothetical protein